MTGFTFKELLPTVNSKEWDSNWDSAPKPESKTLSSIYLLNGYNRECFKYVQNILEHLGFKDVMYVSTSHAHLPLGVPTKVDPLSKQELFAKYFKRIDSGQEIKSSLQQATVIIVDHQTIEYCITKGLQIPLLSFDIPPGSITEFSINNDGWVRVQ
ncbi:hypothetical protein HK103_007628 [Boothiomyces macroporosus]|uniref:Uncharacterized protein n=1 Tax=Boothiomyces macroporosus TaxID=261099 RepID=A0AAD5Y675_9FUNG|nr:hypothetical protein HK103_007628 [Boothiomyces macroporosus]